VNLFDMDSKYADVMPLDSAIALVQESARHLKEVG
jgi:hypothetical protein